MADVVGMNGDYTVYGNNNSQGKSYDELKKIYADTTKSGQSYVDPNSLAAWALKNNYLPNFGDPTQVKRNFTPGDKIYTGPAPDQKLLDQFINAGGYTPQNPNEFQTQGVTPKSTVSPTVATSSTPLASTSQQPTASGSQITRDANGSYLFGGKAYETLISAQSAAKRSGVSAVYTPASVASSPVPTNPAAGTPSRDTYAPGPAGDKQYQLALERFKTAQTPLPTSLSETTNPTQFDTLLNKLQSDQLDKVSSNTDVAVRSNSGDALSGNADFFQQFISGNSNSGISAPSTGASSGAPAFSATDKLTQLRQQYGVDPLEAQVSDIDKQIADIQALQRENQSTEQGKAVALGVMGGRISEEARQASEKIDALNRQKGYLVDQLQNKYNVVNSLMSAAQTDYKNAVDAYDTKFAQTVQATNLMMNMDQSQKTVTEKARDDARANVTIVTNALANGSLQWENLDPAIKTQFSKLELQAGLPTGTIQAFSQKAGSMWEMSTVLPGVDDNGNTIATILQKNKQTGEFKTTKLITDYAPKSSTSAKADVLQQGTFVNDQGNEVAWTRYKDGTVSQVPIGKARQTADQMNPEQKAQNDFNKFFADVVTKMQAQDSFGEPKLNKDGAMKIIKAQYPNITTESLNSLFAGF